MVCCGFCKIMSRKRNDYKVSTVDGIELEPLGGEKSDKKNGVNKFGEFNFFFVRSIDDLGLSIIFVV